MKLISIFVSFLTILSIIGCSSQERLNEGLYHGLQTKERFDAQREHRNPNELGNESPIPYHEYQQEIQEKEESE